MVTAVFNGSNIARVRGLWQYDYGQILRIQGLSLPTAVEIDFSLRETGGDSTPRVGITKDGVTDVVIPDSMIENNECAGDYCIYAFIYITDETSGETTHKIIMPVTSRPKPGAYDTPEDAQLFREAITTVNKSAESANAAAISAEAWAHGHADYPERDEDNAKYYAGKSAKDAERTNEDRKSVSVLAEHVDTVAMQVDADKTETEQYKSQAVQSAANALISEQAAKASETAAQEAQAGAEAAEGQAELFALQTGTDRSEVAIDRETVLAARDEAVSARNTAIENANIATNRADETEADKQTTEANKAATAADKEATAANLAESNRILQEQIQLLGAVPMIYAVTTLEELQAFHGAKAGDFGIITEPRSMLFRYYTKDVNGNDLNPPAWQWMTDLNITFTRESLLGILMLADIALSGSYNDLRDVPNRYNSPIVLDGTSDTITWDYTQSDTALVTLTADKPLTITGEYNGAKATLDVYGAKLILDDAVYLKSATYSYLEAVEGEHYHYEFQRIIDKWQVGMMVVAGAEAEGSETA